MVASAPAVSSPPAPRGARAWFRARLDRDPRRWVLALAALEGLGAFVLNLQEKRASFYGRGVGLVVLLGFSLLLPAVGVLGMLAHGRLLLWSGRLLGGRAAPRDIHAALLYVLFLAEAQRFSAWRGLANHLLAGLLGLALLAGGVAAAYGLWRSAAPFQLVPLALVLSAGVPLAVERVVVLRRRWRAAAAPPR
jgi:hypothetical protein